MLFKKRGNKVIGIASDDEDKADTLHWSDFLEFIKSAEHKRTVTMFRMLRPRLPRRSN